MGLERGMPSKRTSSACVDYVPALCTHRPSLRPISSGPASLSDWLRLVQGREVKQTTSLRGRRSRNKVSVGEPAEGSLTLSNKTQPSLKVAGIVCSLNLNQRSLTKPNLNQIPNDGYLGSQNDEERSEVR